MEEMRELPRCGWQNGETCQMIGTIRWGERWLCLWHWLVVRGFWRNCREDFERWISWVRDYDREREWNIEELWAKVSGGREERSGEKRGEEEEDVGGYLWELRRVIGMEKQREKGEEKGRGPEEKRWMEMEGVLKAVILEVARKWPKGVGIPKELLEAEEEIHKGWERRDEEGFLAGIERYDEVARKWIEKKEKAGAIGGEEI